MAWILDVAIVLIFLLAVWIGYRQGLIKALTGLVAFAVAAAVALLLNSVVAGLIYDKAIAPMVVSIIEESLSDGGSLQEGAEEVLQDMPEFLQNILGNAGIQSGQDVVNQVTGGVTAEEQAQQISDNVIRPVMMAVFRTLCALILFALVLAIATILLRALNVIAKLPVLKQLNKSLGVVAGVISGVLWVLLAATVVQVIAALSSADFVINQTVLEQTHILSWIVSINPLTGAMQDMMLLAAE